MWPARVLCWQRTLYLIHWATLPEQVWVWHMYSQHAFCVVHITVCIHLSTHTHTHTHMHAHTHTHLHTHACTHTHLHTHLHTHTLGVSTSASQEKTSEPELMQLDSKEMMTYTMQAAKRAHCQRLTRCVCVKCVCV